MSTLSIHLKGQEFPLDFPKHTAPTREGMRKAVVMRFIASTDDTTLDDCYKVVQYWGLGEIETVDAATIGEAYQSLDGITRISLFMSHCDPDFSNASQLAWPIKHLLLCGQHHFAE